MYLNYIFYNCILPCVIITSCDSIIFSAIDHHLFSRGNGPPAPHENGLSFLEKGILTMQGLVILFQDFISELLLMVKISSDLDNPETWDVTRKCYLSTLFANVCC